MSKFIELPNSDLIHSDAIQLTEAEQADRGKRIARVLNLIIKLDFPDRYRTDIGTVNDAELFRMLKRMIEVGDL